MNRGLLAALLFCAFAWGTSSAHAAWPDHPIRMIIPYPPGAAGDILIRFMQPALQTQLGQPIIVENRPGAGGNIGTAEVVRAKPDGYTFVLGATNNFVINQFVYKNMSFNPLKDLVPVTRLADVPSVLFVNTTVPSGSYAEFARYAQSHAGKLNFGSPGVGTTPHLSAWALSEALGAKMTHVPFKGAAPGVQALANNEVQMFLVGYGVAASLVATGKIKPLVVASDSRLQITPEVPTSEEVGMPDVILSNWWGVGAPKGTEAAVVDRLAAELKKVLDLPATKNFLARQGFVSVGNTPTQFAGELSGEAKAWQQLVIKAGAQLE